MIVLKIVLILLAVIIFLLFFILLQSVKVVFSFSTEPKLDLRVKILGITLYDANKVKEKTVAETKSDETEVKQKKPSKVANYFKKLFGIDTLTEATKVKENAESEGISDSVNKVVTVISLLLGQLVWLLSKIRVNRFHILAICGGSDAADAAMEYGYVCAAVYPLVGYIDTHLNTKKNATDIQIGCDFENDAYFEIDFIAKLRLIHIVRAVLRNAKNMAKEQARLEANI